MAGRCGVEGWLVGNWMQRHDQGLYLYTILRNNKAIMRPGYSA